MRRIIDFFYTRLMNTYVGRILTRRYYKNKTSRENILQYWRNPPEANLPEKYVNYATISEFLVSIILRYPEMRIGKILEIGCNIGRNLNRLYELGYRNLNGIEINKEATELMNRYYPEMARATRIINQPIEDVIKDLPDKEYKLVFSTAVLHHIHTDSDWIFPEIVRLVGDDGYLLTIENEFAMTDKLHFPRQYKRVFESLGMHQLEVINCGKVKYLKDYNKNFYARMFIKK